MNRLSKFGLHCLCFVASITLGVGIFAPCIQIIPAFGEYTDIVESLRPDMAEIQTYSIISGILELYRTADYFIAVVIFLFSVCFPVFKLSLIWQAVFDLPNRRSLDFVTKAGKYSMLDVFVLGILIVCLKGLPGGTSAEMKYGIIFFTISILLSFIIPAQISKELDRKD